MCLELQAKLLQHLNKKKADQGFTLVELLVVIVIIGILAAVALPNFLSQSAKAKQSEGKQYITAVNRAQHTYRAGSTIFADSFDKLALGTVKGDAATSITGSSTTNYTYKIAGFATDQATAQADSRDTTLKSYSSGIVRFPNPENLPVIFSAACENLATGATAATVPTINTTAAAGGVTCVASTKDLTK